MSGENDGVTRSYGLVQDGVEGLRRLSGQTGIRFIQKDQGRIMKHHSRNTNALLQAARECSNRIFRSATQTHPVQESKNALFGVVDRIEATEEPEVVQSRK